jgi:hypothetical protein
LTGILSAADSDDHVPSCSSSGTSADAVYTFTLTADAFVAIDLVSTYTITPVLSLARHCDEPDLRCDVSRYPDSEHVRLQGSFTPGTYYVYVEAEWGSLGNYTLGVYFSEP